VLAERLVLEAPRDIGGDAGGSALIVYACGDHRDIQEIGRGRYSHWNDNPESGWRTIRGMLFSASDNSDPRTNGRHYWAVLPR